MPRLARHGVAPLIEAMSPSAEVTQMLSELSDGDRTALDRLLPVVYDQLRSDDVPSPTVASDPVHEASVEKRLVGDRADDVLRLGAVIVPDLQAIEGHALRWRSERTVVGRRPRPFFCGMFYGLGGVAFAARRIDPELFERIRARL